MEYDGEKLSELSHVDFGDDRVVRFPPPSSQSSSTSTPAPHISPLAIPRKFITAMQQCTSLLLPKLFFPRPSCVLFDASAHPLNVVKITPAHSAHGNPQGHLGRVLPLFRTAKLTYIPPQLGSSSQMGLCALPSHKVVICTTAQGK